MKRQKFNKLGIALAGGGGRGAYQVGVFRALLEQHLFDKAQILAGTSVGALNSVLFLHRDFHLANYIWRCKIEQAILYLDKGRFRQPLENFWGDQSHDKSLFEQIKGLFQESGFKAGIFSREGLVNILRNEMDLSVVKKSRQNIYATATRASTKVVEFFPLNTLKPDELINILLASSALPGIFSREYINGKEYYDGGIHHNVPIDILYQEGCDLILVLHLFRTRDKVAHQLYPNATIIELTPESSLGGMMGVLDFSSRNVHDLIGRGYADNIDILSSISHRFLIKSRPKFFS